MPRIFRRAELDIYYSEGYHPHPQMSFGPAPQLGMHSLAEVLDVDLTHEVPPHVALNALNEAAPEGLTFTACRRLGKNERGLSKITRAVESLVLLRPEHVARLGGRAGVEQLVLEALAAETLEVQCVRKEGKARTLNGRTWLERLEVWGADRYAELGLMPSEALSPGIAALAPWPDAELGLFLRTTLSNELQPRINELAHVITGLELGPDRIVRVRVLAEVSPGTLADPLDSPEATGVTAPPPPPAAAAEAPTELLQIV
jgi:radical SAM-linked protein